MEMKIFLIVTIVIVVILVIFQTYITMATGKSETQSYKVIRTNDQFEIRYYPAAIMAKISSTSKSYRDLGYSGFGKLAKYIFGGNSDKKQIAMTSPVHMDIGDSMSTMAFVMPAEYTQDELPKPDNAEIDIQTTEAEYVAVITFGGFASTDRINKHKTLLQQHLKEKGIAYFGNFRFLGYNPPFQLFGRRNEVIVSVDEPQTLNSNQ
jgi:SOUL heme-binding protein